MDINRIDITDIEVVNNSYQNSVVGTSPTKEISDQKVSMVIYFKVMVIVVENV